MALQGRHTVSILLKNLHLHRIYLTLLKYHYKSSKFLGMSEDCNYLKNCILKLDINMSSSYTSITSVFFWSRFLSNWAHAYFSLFALVFSTSAFVLVLINRAPITIVYTWRCYHNFDSIDWFTFCFCMLSVQIFAIFLVSLCDGLQNSTEDFLIRSVVHVVGNYLICTISSRRSPRLDLALR